MQPDQPHSASNIDSIIIDDVNKDLWSYIKARYFIQLVFAALGTILYYSAAIYLFFKLGIGSGSNGRGEGYVLALPFIIMGSWYHGLQSKFEEQFLKEFAQSNGFSFAKTGLVGELYGTIFKMKGRPDISDIVTGSYNNLPLRIFLYQLTQGSGRSQQTWQDTVFEIDFPVQLPSLMLAKKGHTLGGGLDVANEFKGNKLQLEGNFSENFDLLVPSGLQVEALQVFTPDVMDVLQNLKSDFRAIELAGNKGYIYINGYINKSSALQSAFTLSKALIDKLSLVANDFRVDPTISAVPTTLSSTGKKSKITLERVMFGIFVLVLVFMCIALIVARQYQY